MEKCHAGHWELTRESESLLGGKAGSGLTLGTATRKTGAISQRLASAGLCPYTLIGVTVLKDIDVLICLWV